MNFCDSIKSKNGSALECASSVSSNGYNSLADTSVYILIQKENDFMSVMLTRTSQTCEDPIQNDKAVGNPGVLTLSEVLLTELLRLENWGVVKSSKESLEKFLRQEIEAMKSKGSCDDIEATEYTEGVGANHIVGPACCSVIQNKTAIFPIKIATPNFGIQKIAQGKFRIEGVNAGVEYKVFDMNGKLLQQKNLNGNSIQVPHQSVILEINGMRKVLK